MDEANEAANCLSALHITNTEEEMTNERERNIEDHSERQQNNSLPHI